MSIRSSESGHIRVLPPVPKQPLSEDPFITLTEVACTAIYGAPLTPGRDGTLRKWVQTASAAKSLWWRIREPINPSDGANWFGELTPAPKASDLAASVQQLVNDDPEWVRSRMESISSTGGDWRSALEWAAGQPYVLGEHGDDLEQTADRFYRHLSSAVAQREIDLWGSKAAHAGQSPGDHEIIQPAFLLTPRVHDLEENEVRVGSGAPAASRLGTCERPGDSSRNSPNLLFSQMRRCSTLGSLPTVGATRFVLLQRSMRYNAVRSARALVSTLPFACSNTSTGVASAPRVSAELSKSIHLCFESSCYCYFCYKTYHVWSVPTSRRLGSPPGRGPRRAGKPPLQFRELRVRPISASVTAPRLNMTAPTARQTIPAGTVHFAPYRSSEAPATIEKPAYVKKYVPSRELSPRAFSPHSVVNSGTITPGADLSAY